MPTTPKSLPALLRKGLAPVYLLSGEEPLTQGEAGDAIRAAARDAGFTEREVFFVDRANAGPWDNVYAASQALSLFASRRLIEIRIPGGKPGEKGAKALQELARLAGPDLMLLVTTGPLDWSTRKAAWVQGLDAAGVWIDAAPVSAAEFPAWLAARAGIEGVQLDVEAIALLAGQTEGNLLAAVQELRKLALAGHARAGAAEVLAGSAQSSRYDVTQLGEAALRGDTARALKVLAGLKSEGVEPPLVLWSLWQELRALWLALVPGAQLNTVWSRNRQHLPAAAARFRPLGRAFFARVNTRLADADRVVKGRRHGDPWDALGLAVAEFAGGRAVLPEERPA